MEVKKLLKQGRDIWGDKNLSLFQIIVCLGKVFCDICCWERDAVKDKDLHTDKDLKKEVGNVFSTIRWCDDLVYDPEECIQEAIKCQ